MPDLRLFGGGFLFQGGTITDNFFMLQSSVLLPELL